MFSKRVLVEASQMPINIVFLRPQRLPPRVLQQKRYDLLQRICVPLAPRVFGQMDSPFFSLPFTLYRHLFHVDKWLIEGGCLGANCLCPFH